MNAEVAGIPQGWDQISPAWMTAALARASPGVQVESMRVGLRDDGTNRRARLGPPLDVLFTWLGKFVVHMATKRPLAPAATEGPGDRRTHFP